MTTDPTSPPASMGHEGLRVWLVRCPDPGDGEPTDWTVRDAVRADELRREGWEGDIRYIRIGAEKARAAVSGGPDQNGGGDGGR